MARILKFDVARRIGAIVGIKDAGQVLAALERIDLLTKATALIRKRRFVVNAGLGTVEGLSDGEKRAVVATVLNAWLVRDAEQADQLVEDIRGFCGANNVGGVISASLKLVVLPAIVSHPGQDTFETIEVTASNDERGPTLLARRVARMVDAVNLVPASWFPSEARDAMCALAEDTCRRAIGWPNRIAPHIDRVVRIVSGPERHWETLAATCASLPRQAADSATKSRPATLEPTRVAASD